MRYKPVRVKEEIMNKFVDNFGIHGFILIMAIVIGIFRSIG